MAGDWIKMRGNLWDDPRVARLCDITDQGEAPIIGALYWLWATADQHSEDGILPGLTLRQIDRKTGVPGFGAAMCGIGWLEDNPDGARILRFEEHNGTSAKRRCMEAQRKANSRNVSACDADNERTQGGDYAELEKEKSRGDIHPTSDEVGSREACASTALGSTKTEDEGMPPCPHDAIIDVFHRLLPTARRVRDWTPARQALLRARWREDRKRQAIEWWERFFAYCAKSKFLTGQVAPKGRKPFELGLEWLAKAENFAKVREGAYHDDEVDA